MTYVESHGSLKMLRLSQIRSYEKGIRVLENPQFEGIKASLRARGLDQPLAVTQRPGDEFYILRSGGSARLEALRELWRETREKRFETVQCVFYLWESELSIFTGHMVGKIAQGHISFWEEALVIRQLSEQLLQDPGKYLLHPELEQLLLNQGIAISCDKLRVMLEAVIWLFPSINIDLLRGLSYGQCAQLLQLKDLARRLWKKVLGSDDNFADIWNYSLSFCGARVIDELTPEAVRTKFLNEVSIMFSVPLNNLELALAQLESGELTSDLDGLEYVGGKDG